MGCTAPLAPSRSRIESMPPHGRESSASQTPSLCPIAPARSSTSSRRSACSPAALSHAAPASAPTAFPSGGPRSSKGSRHPASSMCASILSITAGSVITLTIFISTWHLRHSRGSISKILCRRRARLGRGAARSSSAGRAKAASTASSAACRNRRLRRLRTRVDREARVDPGKQVIAEHLGETLLAA